MLYRISGCASTVLLDVPAGRCAPDDLRMTSLSSPVGRTEMPCLGRPHKRGSARTRPKQFASSMGGFQPR